MKNPIERLLKAARKKGAMISSAAARALLARYGSLDKIPLTAVKDAALRGMRKRARARTQEAAHRASVERTGLSTPPRTEDVPEGVSRLRHNDPGHAESFDREFEFVESMKNQGWWLWDAMRTREGAESATRDVESSSPESYPVRAIVKLIPGVPTDGLAFGIFIRRADGGPHHLAVARARRHERRNDPSHAERWTVTIYGQTPSGNDTVKRYEVTGVSEDEALEEAKRMFTTRLPGFKINEADVVRSNPLRNDPPGSVPRVTTRRDGHLEYHVHGPDRTSKIGDVGRYYIEWWDTEQNAQLGHRDFATLARAESWLEHTTRDAEQENPRAPSSALELSRLSDARLERRIAELKHGAAMGMTRYGHEVLQRALWERQRRGQRVTKPENLIEITAPGGTEPEEAEIVEENPVHASSGWDERIEEPER